MMRVKLAVQVVLAMSVVAACTTVPVPDAPEPLDIDVAIQATSEPGVHTGLAMVITFAESIPGMANAHILIQPTVYGHETTPLWTHYAPEETRYQVDLVLERNGRTMRMQEYSEAPMSFQITLDVDRDGKVDQSEPGWLYSGITLHDLLEWEVVGVETIGGRVIDQAAGSGPQGRPALRRDGLTGVPSGFFGLVPVRPATYVPIDTDIHVSLRRTVDEESAIDAFSITPYVDHVVYVRPFTGASSSIITVELAELQPHTSYVARFETGVLIQGQPTTEPIVIGFTTGDYRQEDKATLPGRAAITEPSYRSSARSFVLRWTAVPGATHYEVQQTTESDFEKATKSWETHQTSLPVEVARSTEWYYRVRGLDEDGNATEWSRIHLVAVAANAR